MWEAEDAKGLLRGTHCRMKDVDDLFVSCKGETVTPSVYPLSWCGNGTDTLPVVVVQSKKTKCI